MISLREITVQKGGIKLLEDFSWKVLDGEHWLITGANGSGKTTLLETIAGQLHVSKGQIDIDFIKGNSWDERHAERRRTIHYLPAHAIQTFLNHNQEQYYQQRYYGMGDERTPLVSDILGEVGQLDGLELPESFSLKPFLSLEVTRLSNGQLKKLLLLKILLSGIPRVLLFDYPFDGLDKHSRKDLCDFIDFLASNYRIQIILVDHHHTLPKVLNRKLVLRNFSVEEESFPDTVARHRSSTSAIHRSVDMPLSEPVVEIVDLKIQYNDTVIMDNFNWTVRKGERWALIGRNGAGKTTLFSMIFADHPKAYTQQIYLFGRKRGTGESIWDIKRRITYLGPELMSYLSPAHIALTCRSYIRATIRGDQEKLFEDLTAAFSADAFLDHPVRALSSGQLQVALIIKCFLNNTEMLLLDEPFQFLDPTQKDNLVKVLRSMLHPEKTLILITHDEQDLITWTDHTKRI
ncbi:MAG TPA: ATP-binding cassette domain-containing protein [Chryseolinea sp.]|nr:ATP-binding cassette domain-containing protein [Chryseolinea sp.]